MDLKITKKRLDNHFSYDWWKYIAILIASIFLWSLLFTTMSPRLHYSKKLEIFFIVNGYSHEQADKLRNELKTNLNKEFVEISFYNYTPDDNVTSQVLTARMSVKEGDMFAFPHSEDNENNLFGSYVDSYSLSDFNTLIEEAKQFGGQQNIMTREQFEQINEGKREYNTEEKMENGFLAYVNTCERAKEEAEKLEGYIEQYPEIFYKYKKFSVMQHFDENIQPHDELIWGLNLAMLTKIRNFSHGGFIYTAAEEDQPFNYALGISSFKEENMPLYYENIAVINYFIEKYYIEDEE